jgi:ribosome-interacting GTPase 1
MKVRDILKVKGSQVYSIRPDQTVLDAVAILKQHRILHRGQTVEDVARLVHKDLARSFGYARVWGTTGFDGQQVGREHPVEDSDVVELHS